MTKSFAALKKQLTPTLKEYGVQRSYVFGSVARGEATRRSDLDLLVYMPPSASLLTLISLQQKLEGSLGRRVDVVTPGAISSRLFKYIKPDLLRVI